VQGTAARGEDVLAAVADDDEWRVLCGFDDDTLGGLRNGVHVQHVGCVDPDRHLRRRDEQCRGDACEPVWRVFVEALDRLDLEFEPLGHAADDILVEYRPAETVPQLYREIAPSSSELATDGNEIDRLVLHGLFVPSCVRFYAPRA